LRLYLQLPLVKPYIQFVSLRSSFAPEYACLPVGRAFRPAFAEAATRKQVIFFQRLSQYIHKYPWGTLLKNDTFQLGLSGLSGSSCLSGPGEIAIEFHGINLCRLSGEV
ncbi:MAG: hypothetical protein QME90_10990, partial [Thermodesulfobacteriota bacterium]|nr:hypothetical protein [Thermodesulfobacteriota bacterium]